MKKLWILFGLLVVPGAIAHAKVKEYAPEGTPTRAIQALDDTLDTYILHPTTPEEERFNADLKKRVLEGTFNIRELCRLSLDKYWNQRSRSEQNSFVDLMTRLLEKKAIFSKEHGARNGSKATYFVTYEGDRPLNPEKTVSRVKTSVNIPSEDLKISLDYKVKKVGGEWKIYDVIVDEASLVDNYRYQFDRIIGQNGYDELILRMESKFKELEQKEGPPQTPTKPEKKSRFGCSLFFRHEQPL